VNNAIKHNGVLNEEIKRFSEFSDKDEFSYENLENFYNRIRPKVEWFSEELRKKVDENLYEFPAERLTSMANKYYERMDDRTLYVFIQKLKEKLIDYPDKDQELGINDLPF